MKLEGERENRVIAEEMCIMWVEKNKPGYIIRDKLDKDKVKENPEIKAWKYNNQLEKVEINN